MIVLDNPNRKMLDKSLCSILIIGAHWNSLIELLPVSNLEACLLRHKEHCHLDISLVNNCDDLF